MGGEFEAWWKDTSWQTRSTVKKASRMAFEAGQKASQEENKRLREALES